jgi:hypothetical protein
MRRGGSFDGIQDGEVISFRGRLTIAPNSSTGRIPGCPSFGFAPKTRHGVGPGKPVRESADKVQEVGPNQQNLKREEQTRSPGGRVELTPGREEEIKNHGELKRWRPKKQMGFGMPRLCLRSFITELLMGLWRHPSFHHEISHEDERHERATSYPRMRFEEW